MATGRNFNGLDIWHKGRLWKEAPQVPLTIAAPKVTRPDTQSGEAVALENLYPTLCEHHVRAMINGGGALSIAVLEKAR